MTERIGNEPVPALMWIGIEAGRTQRRLPVVIAEQSGRHRSAMHGREERNLTEPFGFASLQRHQVSDGECAIAELHRS